MNHIVTPDQVCRTAALAKLRLNDTEVQLMCRDLAALLDIADGLEQAKETSDAAVGRSFMLLREDVPHACMPREELLCNVSEHADGMVSVPGAIREDA